MKHLSRIRNFLILTTSLLLSSLYFVSAQSAANYAFTTNASGSMVTSDGGSANDISNAMASSTVLIGPSQTSGVVSSVVNIGFDFWFMGTRYTQFNANNYGYVGLGNSSITNVNQNTKTLTTASICPFNLNASGTAPYMGTNSTGMVHSAVVGTAPNRILVVEWLNMNMSTSTLYSSDGTFQLRLYETSGKIEFVYGVMAPGGLNSGSVVSYSNVQVAFGNSASSDATVNISSNACSYNTAVINNTCSSSATITNLHSTSDGSRREYIFTPNVVGAPVGPVYASSVTTSSITVNWSAPSGAPAFCQYAIFRSDDGGNTYNFITTIPNYTTSYSPANVVANQPYYFNVYAVTEGAISSAISGSVTTAAGVTPTYSGSGNWSNAGNWGGTVPAITDDVTIPNGSTVTIDGADLCHNLTVNGTLQYSSAAGTYSLTASGDITIGSTGSFVSNSTGSGTNTLNLGSASGNTSTYLTTGNLTVNGTFNMEQAAGNLVKTYFCGAGNSTVSGSGTINFSTNTNVYKGAIGYPNVTTLNIQSNFTGGASSSASVGPFAITYGTLEISGTFSETTNPVFNTAAYTLPLAGGFWLNNANFTVAAQAGNVTNNGFLRVSNGTYNVGTSASNSLVIGSTAIGIWIEQPGGNTTNVNITGGLYEPSSTTDYWTYEQTGGTVTLNTSGAFSNAAGCFDMGPTPSQYASFFDMTGGTIIIDAPNATTTIGDFRGAPVGVTSPVFGSFNVSGGTVQLGTASGKTFFIQQSMPSVTVFSGSGITLNGNTYIGGAYTNSGAGIFTMGTTGYNLTFKGAINNSGTFTESGLASNTLTFWGTSAQTLGGTITSSTLYAVTVYNAAGVTIPNSITIKTSLTLVTGALTANSGVIGGGGAGNFTLFKDNGTLAGSPTPTVSYPTTNGSCEYIYLGSGASTPTTTGIELPAAFSSTGNFLVMDNFNGVTLNQATSVLKFGIYFGILTTTSVNLLTVTGTASGTTNTASIYGGNTNAYVYGPLIHTFIASLSGSNTYLFPVGKSVYNMFELINPTTSAGTSSLLRVEAFDGSPAGAGNPITAGPGLAVSIPTRYWSVIYGTGTGTSTFSTMPTFLFTDASGDILSSSVVGNSSTQNGTYASLGSASITASTIDNSTTSPTPPDFYIIGNAILDPTAFTATSNSTTQINLLSAANSSGNNIAVAYNTTGVFTAPASGTNPATVGTGNAFVGGTLYYYGAAASLTTPQTGLTANTVYYYKAFSYDGSYNYSPGITANATTYPLAPTSPTNTTASATTTQIVTSWTAPTQGAAAFTYQLDYTTDPTLTTGITTVTGISSATPTKTVTPLSVGTMYYARARCNNAAGNSANSGTIQAATLPNAVTLPVYTTLGGTTETISWTSPTGFLAGANTVLVFVKATSAVTAGTPTNAPSTYTANNTFGSGTAYQNDAAAYCVYAGTGTNVTVSGLTASTTYDILVYAVVNITNTDGKNSYSASLASNFTTGTSGSVTANSYQFAASTATYTALSGATSSGMTSTTVGVANGVSIGFNFTFCGTTYTTINLSSNGFVTFGANTITSEIQNYANNLNSGASGNVGANRPFIAPLWDQMSLTTAASDVSYKLAGSAPNRTFTIQWANIKWGPAAAGTVINFQLVIYEDNSGALNNGRIDFIYSQGATAVNGVTSASIGIAGPNTGDFLSLNNVTSLALPSSLAETTNLATRPGSGQVYSFAPTAGAVAGGSSYTVGATGGGVVTYPATSFNNFATLGGINGAIPVLNAAGISGTGNVTYNLKSGGTETAPGGGIPITAQGTSANQAIFLGASGSPYTVTANSTLIAGNLIDNIFALVGAQYITLEYLKLQENGNSTYTNATNNMTEWAIALLDLNTTTGAQNNTIQNCIISLNLGYQNSFGIYSNTTHAYTVPGTAVAITASSGSNSYNKVYGNSISAVNFPIAFVGYNTLAANASWMDQGNDVGGSSGTTGNTLSNWGGTVFTTATFNRITTTSGFTGIYMANQTGYNVSYNSITNATGFTSAATTTPVVGILGDYDVSTVYPVGTFTNTISHNNPVTIVNAGTAAGVTAAIESNSTAGVAAVSGATVSITNNTITGCQETGTATANPVKGIVNAVSAGVLSISSNTFTNNSSTMTTTAGAVFVPILNSGAVVNILNINSNHLGTSGSGFSYAAVNTGITATIFINNTGGANSAALSISGNDFQNISYTGAASNPITFISNTAGALTENISSNTFTNLTLGTTGTLTFITNVNSLPANGSKTVSSNSIVTGVGKTAGGTVSFYSDAASTSPATATLTYNNNVFTNFTITGVTATTIAGWNCADGGAANKSIHDNQFGILGGTGTITTGGIAPTAGVISVGNGTPSGTYNIYNNSVAVTGATTVGAICAYYIQTGSPGTGTVNVYTNTASVATSSSGIFGFYLTSGAAVTTFNVYNNTITSLAGAVSNVYGIDAPSGGTANYNISNKDGNGNVVGPNVIYGLSTSGTSYGIALATSGTNTISNNTIGKSGSPIGSSAGVGIGTTAGATGSTTVSGNTVSYVQGTTGATYGIYFIGVGAATATNNTVSNISANSATAFGIAAGSSLTSSATVTGNTITSVSSNTGAWVSGINIYGTGSIPMTIKNNKISGISVNTSTGKGLGIYLGSASNAVIRGNEIVNVTGATGAFGILDSTISNTNTSDTIVSNICDTIITTSGNAHGIHLSTNGSNFIYKNIIDSISSAGAAGYFAWGLDVTTAITATTSYIYKNEINAIHETGGGAVQGLAVSNKANAVLPAYIYNNSISLLSYAGNVNSQLTSAVSAYNSASMPSGIFVTGGSASSPSMYLFYNTVYVNLISTGANFSSAALSATPTAAEKLILNNNIFINLSAPVGSGYSAAYIVGSANESYQASSNNNFYWTGSTTPSAAYPLFWNAATPIAADYGVTDWLSVGADGHSPSLVAINATPSFIQTYNSLGNSNCEFVSPYTLLNITNGSSTAAESGGANITSPITITDDINGTIRQGNTGYSGAGTAPDIGAFEFNGACNNLPTITLVNTGNAAVCKGTTSVSLPYSATLYSPNEYSVVWSNGATMAGFSNITNHSFSGNSMGGTDISLTVPGGAAAATYMGTLTVENSTAGCTSSGYTINITINPLPVPSFTVGPASVCIGSAGNVYTTQTGESNYAWTISGGTITAGGGTANSSSTVTWPASGTKSIAVNYTDGNGCTATSASSQSVTVHTLPVPGFTAAPTPVCLNSTGNVYTTQGLESGYMWGIMGGMITAGGTATDNTATVTWNTEGTGSISVNYTDGFGCTAASATTQSVTVNGLPTVMVSPTTVNPCPGDITPLTASGALTYTWLPSTQLSATTGSTVNASPISNITYTVTGKDINGCTGNATSAFTVKPAPVITVNPTDAVCTGSSTAMLTASCSGYCSGITYSWSPSTYLDVSTGNVVNASISTLTFYTVTGTADNSCSAVGNTVPVATVPAGGNITPVASVVCSGGTETLTATGAAGHVYQWQISSNNVYWTDIGGATNTTYTTQIADGITKKYYRIIAQSNTCWYVSSTTSIVDVSVTPIITISSVTSTTVTVTWTPFGSGQYNISWSGTAGSGSANALTANTYQITSLTPNANLLVTVTPVTPTCAGVSANSMSTSTLCAVPGNFVVAVAPAPAHAFKATWNAVGGATTYRIYYRNLLTSSSWSFVDTAGTQKTVVVPYGGATYAVYVAAKDCPASGNFGDGSAVTYITTNTLPSCSPIPSVTATSNCPNQLTITITGGSGSYALSLREISPNLTAGASYNISGSLFSITVGTQYAGSVWEIYARNLCSPGVYSALSDIAIVTVKPGCPMLNNLVLSHVSCYGFIASWNTDNCAGLGITAYQVLIKKNANLNYNGYSFSGGTDYAVVNWLSQNTTYNVEIRTIACNGATSSISNVDTISLPSCREEEPAEDVTVKSIGDNKEAVAVYPNPADGRFFIDIGRTDMSTSTVKIELVNQLGQVIETNISTISGGHSNQMMSAPEGIASGIYFVRTTVCGNVYTNRLMIANE